MRIPLRRSCIPAVLATIFGLGDPSAWCFAGEAGETTTEEPIGATARVASDPSAFHGRVVSSIEVQGNRKTREDVILREIETAVGAALDPEVLASDLTRLSNTQLFASAQVAARADGSGGVELVFIVRESPSIIPFPAVTYTEADGFSYGAGVVFANLRGKAHTLAATGLLGGARQGTIAFSNPWWFGNRVSIALRAGHTARDDTVRDFVELSDQATLSLGTWLGRAGRLTGTASVFRMRADVDGQTLSSDNDDTLVSLGAALGVDTRDDWRDPRRGWDNEMSVTRTGGILGGDGDFWTLALDLRRYQPLLPRQTLAAGVLVSRRTGDVGQDVPPFLQYHLGGTNTIRGNTLESLGRELFGKSEIIATAEYRFTALAPRRVDLGPWSINVGLQLAAFADSGTAWTERRDLRWERFRHGAGVGARILLPGAEMIRLDLGYSREGGWHFHFAALSKFDAQRGRVR